MDALEPEAIGLSNEIARGAVEVDGAGTANVSLN
jgi:hypothetical protein